jgi:hypothetical protein
MSEKMPEALNDGVIEIGNAKIPCSVLEGEIRVLTQEGFLNAIGRAGKAKAGTGASVDRLPAFLSARNIKPFISQELEESTKPIRFKTAKGSMAFGYRAELLPQVCEVYLKARDAGKLSIRQKHIAIQADILMRGLAHVGIIALIDEATGYQYIRARRALDKILDMFIAKELSKWAKIFPDEFYEHLFRLRGWQYYPMSVKKPAYVGKLTNDIVYMRLAPGVLEQLKKLNPITSTGRRRHKHHQWLTEDIGHPQLREHLASIILLMKVSKNWNTFYRMLQQGLPRKAQTIEMYLETENGEIV